MIYKVFCDEKISTIGMGCMRLPLLSDDPEDIDIAQVDEMVDWAIEHGVNYFDTAWGYHNGRSEIVTGASLARHPRETWHIASKFPGYDNSNFGKHEEIFQKQLEKCGVEYFDFYLIHNVTESNIDDYLAEDRYHTMEFFVKQKELGAIKHLGFSCHGDFDTFERFMDKFGDIMEFCQLQINYQDWDFQNAKLKVDYLNERNIPIVVMEPLRGGHLIDFSKEETEKLDALRPGISAPEWAYRYVQSVPGVGVTLSGMSTLEQCKQNIEIFETEAPLNDEERQALYDISAARLASDMVPCTSCRYCTEYCPIELDIPVLIGLYNENLSKDDEHWMMFMKIQRFDKDKQPSACIACGSCSAVCPQQIDIPDVLAKLAQAAGQA